MFDPLTDVVYPLKSCSAIVYEGVVQHKPIVHVGFALGRPCWSSNTLVDASCGVSPQILNLDESINSTKEHAGVNDSA